MTIIIGLGNPGEKFKNTRHNAGFAAVDFFAQKNNFPEFKLSKKYQSLISENENVMLVKPQTFMNESGKAVKSTLKKKRETELIIIHDDIDLPLGKIKLSKDSGDGGHKGVNSIIHHLGKQDFVRLKIGICPTSGKPKAVEKFVIEKFNNKEEMQTLHKVIEMSANALDMLINEGLEKTMNEYNR